MWKNFIEHTKKVEETFWKIDFVVEMENMGSNVMTITGETSSELSTDDDDDDDDE